MDSLKFGCTMCGRCCHGQGLPLTLDESTTWLEDGGRVNILCEAHTYLSEPPKEDTREDYPLADHRRRRSFAVRCGATTARVTAIFVAQVTGACRNLSDDMKCRIYDRRPLVCRIYPAEISPFIQLDTALKACPPEAWESGDPLLSGGQLVDEHLRRLVEQSKHTDRDDVARKSLICSELKMHVSGVADEGYITYEPDGRELLEVLKRSRQGGGVVAEPEWQLFSPSTETGDALRALGLGVVGQKQPDDAYEFLYGMSRKRPS